MRWGSRPRRLTRPNLLPLPCKLMSQPRVFLEWTCARCGRKEQSGRRELIDRLRDLGMLRRDDGRDIGLLLELARSKSAELKCPACESPGYLPQETSGDDFDDLPPPRPCMACGGMIPPERVELFPESDLCAGCQRKVDRGETIGGDDYCERCGSPLVMRKSSAGITRYQQVCPQCRR